MTALAGLWDISGGPNAGDACRHMLAAQRVYGPDGPAVWDSGEIAIGRTLFELLPEDVHDRGPVASLDGRYTLTGDARLDNRDELVGLLGIGAEESVRLPDSAFLLRAWERWGEGCFEHLYGSYAFALWDSKRAALFLARDHIGTRPLHYHRSGRFVAFASMPKGLHALPEIPYAPDAERLAETLALLPEVGSGSFFRGIERVEGGHFVMITRHGVTVQRHWDPTPQSIEPWSGDGDPAAALRAHLDRAVAACLRGVSDKVGAHLSAGLDSGSVAATAARVMATRGGRVVAFTAVPREGYDGPVPERRLGDEGPLAAATAALYPNIDHMLVRGTAAPVDQDWDRSFYFLERPLLNPCNDRWWTAINAEARARGVNIMLTGEMGNMTLSFAGLELLPELVRKRAWAELWRQARALVRTRRMRWRGVVAMAFGPWVPAPFWAALTRKQFGRRHGIEAYTALSVEQVRKMNFAKLAGARKLDPAYRPRKDAFESRLWTLRRIDKGNFQKAALGGFGIDQRDPTADRRLIEFCLSLPTSLFANAGELRLIGRRAFADRLPASVLDEQRKGYQAADWHEGLAAARELDADLASLEELPEAAILDLSRMRKLAKSIPVSGWESPDIIAAYRLTLLRGSAAGHFLRRATKTNR